MKKFWFISIGVGVAAWLILRDQMNEPAPSTSWGAQNRASGKLDQAIGSLKQGVGETFGSDHLANEGALDQAKGAVKDTVGKAADVINTAVNDASR